MMVIWLKLKIIIKSLIIELLLPTQWEQIQLNKLHDL